MKYLNQFIVEIQSHNTEQNNKTLHFDQHMNEKKYNKIYIYLKFEISQKLRRKKNLLIIHHLQQKVSKVKIIIIHVLTKQKKLI